MTYMSETNKHTLGGGSEVSANGRRAAVRAAWGRSPYDTRIWVTAYDDFRIIDAGECRTYCVCK